MSSDDSPLTVFMVSTATSRPVTGSSPNGPYTTPSWASKGVRVSLSAPPLMQSTKDSKVSRCGANVVMVTPRSGSDLVGAPRPSAGGEVIAVVQIGEQFGLSGLPAQGLARDEVGRREVHRDQIREEPKVSRQHQCVRGNAHCRQAQTVANGLGDLAKRGAPVLTRVPISASRTLLQRQAEQGGDVADVHGAPQVRAVSGVTGEALLLRERDQPREEAGTIGRAVRDGRKPHDRRPHSPLGEADYGGLHDVTNTQGALVLIAAGKGRVLLGGRPAQVPGRAYAAGRDQRLSGSRECLAVREHDGELRGGHGVHPAGRKQVLPVRDVDDAVGVRGRILEPVEILEAAETYLRALRGQCRRGRVRPGQPGDLVPGGDELGDDVRTGVAGPASDENAHVTVLLRVGGAQLRMLTPRTKLVCLTEWATRPSCSRATFSSARA